MTPQNLPSVSIEPTSIDAKFVVGGQRMSIKVSFEQTSLDADAPSSTLESAVVSAEEDIYVFLKGSAHILPATGGRMEVAFLDEAGNRKQSLFFKPNENTGTQMLKVPSLDLIIKCNKAEFEALTPDDKKRIFPNTIYEIVEDTLNQKDMNTTDPPIRR